MVQHIIIGSGVAGVTAAEKLHASDPSAEIAIITSETHPFYYRPRVPAVLEGTATADQILAKPKDWYDENGIDLRLNTRVTAVDPESNSITIRTASGAEEPLGYETLLIATGASPRKLPLPGIDLDGVLTMRDLGDVATIEAYLDSARPTRAAVIGGGLLGVELARALTARGLEVEMINLLDWYWPEMLNEKAARIVEARIAENGITLHNSTETTAILGDDDGRVRGIRTSDGRELDYDLVAIAVGVQPTIGFLAGSGIETDRGIIVDEHLRTNYPNIYAAGDVSQAYDIVYEKHLVHTAWPIAKGQGEIAGQNLAGEDRKYLGGIPSNTIRIFGLTVTSMGICQHTGDNGYETFDMAIPDRDIYKRYILRNDKFIGATFITDTAEAPVAELLIKEEIDMSLVKDQLEDPEFTFAPYLQTNLKIVCPVCKAELKLKLGSKPGDRLVCPICDATLELHEKNGTLVPEEIIVPD